MIGKLQAFVDDLKATHKENLTAVILYGSSAAGDFIPNVSDYNVLIVLGKITPEDLRASYGCAREWCKIGNPLPNYFTANEIETAGDVFPIEFHQMALARKVLFGRDVLADVVISDKFLRHQLEFELRSKLLQLRRAYIPATMNADGLKKLLAESLASFTALMGAALILFEGSAPVTKHEIIERAAKVLSINADPFAKILEIRENTNKSRLTDAEAHELFGMYLSEIENMIVRVDSFKRD